MKTETINSAIPWFEVGTRVTAMYYGTRNGVIVKETPTRVWIEIKMPGRYCGARPRSPYTVVKAYRKVAQKISERASVQLGDWAVRDIEIEARYHASRYPAEHVAKADAVRCSRHGFPRSGDGCPKCNAAEQGDRAELASIILGYAADRA